MVNGKSRSLSRIIQPMTREWRIAGRTRFKAWLQFLLCVLFFSLLIGFGGTWFSRALDFVFVCVSFAFIGVLSILITRAWQRRRNATGSKIQINSDAGDKILRRVRRWWTDE
jgi:membrane protein implicated in regulation of membrane protease activity